MIAKLLRRPHLLIAVGVFALTLGVYSLTLGPTADFWDCGEYITTSHIVGVPHQPGTPLYVLMGRVFDVVLGDADITRPAPNTAWAVNFMSAFFSALAVAFVFLLIRDLSRRADPDAGWLAEVGGVVGALFLAFSETFWNNAVEAEVYGLSGFMIAFLSWLGMRWYDYRERAASDHIMLLIIYLLALGVGFHLGSLLVYPGIFLIALLASRRHLPLVDLLLISAGLGIFMLSTMVRDTGLVILLLVVYLLAVGVRSVQGRHFTLVASALFFVGLSVHLMMMVRAGASPEPLINQTDPDNFATLMSVVRREQYPPMNPFQRQAPLDWQFGYYYGFLFRQFYFLGPGHGVLSAVATVLGPVFLALVGLFHGLRRVRPLIWLPLAGYLINGEILTLQLNFTDHEVRERDYFYFAAFLFFAVFIGMGASALLRYLAGGEGRSAREVAAGGGDWRRIAGIRPGLVVKVAALVLVLASLLPVSPGHHKYFSHDRSENRISYEYSWNILAGLDENAILFTNGDNDTFPIWYLQMVERFRPDVTVVNLSLVNLPWYIKQLRTHHGLDMARTDTEIDELRHRWYEDPRTGEREVIMIKDYVLHDIIGSNRSGAGRPVFFAVTIPEENMKRYWSHLSMEGMAYRLTETAGEDNQPVVNAAVVMENMMGVYRMDALQTGSTEERRRAYAALAGRADDQGDVILGRGGRRISAGDLAGLSAMMGDSRTDVFRGINANHLLGNYPTALNRAGYEYYREMDRVALTDSVAYAEALRNALTAFETSLRVEPWNPPALEFYPLLLVQAYRDEDAKAVLTSLAGNVSPEVEERVVYSTMRGLVRGGLSDLAQTWLEERVAAAPDRHFYRQALFGFHVVAGQVAAAEQVAADWATHSGVPDPEMAQVLEEMREKARAQEDQRIRDALGGSHE